MSQQNNARPTTAAQRSPANQHDEQYDDEEDDDVGMFSFLPPVAEHSSASSPHSARPQTSTNWSTDQSTTQRPTTAFMTPLSPAYNPSMFNSSPHPSQLPDGGSLAGAPISPAAAYALAAQHGLPPTADGPRRREPWQSSAESPTHYVGNPYEQGLEVPRRTSDNSSGATDKSKTHLDPRWDDQGRSETESNFGIDQDGYAIRMRDLSQSGHPLATTRSEDEKDFDPTVAPHNAMYGEQDFDYDDEEDSPFPEVRASVSNIDDPEMPCLTFRTWTLGLTMTIVVSAANAFFALRFPSPYITPIIVQVIVYPIGKLMAWLPATSWSVPKRLQILGLGEEFSFNPGPFNIKEHTIIVMMANVATGPAYGLYFSVVATKFYDHDLGAGFDILLTITSQMIGFGVAGLCRRFLVWPAGMIWPQNLVYCTLLNTFHAEDDDDDDGELPNARGLSRYRFFTYAFAAAFFWYWLPGFLFNALSVFSFICWAAPNNVVINQLFGIETGLGMSMITFDWSQINYIVSPLVIPWWALANTFVGFVIAFWIVSPAMYYSNTWYSAYLPISTSGVFDRFGQSYNTSAIVDATGVRFNLTAYEEYSPVYLPITYATEYGCAFLMAMALITHTVLYQGKEIMAAMTNMKRESEDIHMKLMRNYPEVPDWWYWLFLAVSVGLSIAAVAGFDTQMPVWGIILSLVIGFIYVLPGGFVFAMTGTQITINLIVELVGGYVMPGLPFANMLFKVYAFDCVASSLTFVQDLKLGHYMKIPPRSTFAAQFVSTFIAALVQVGVKRGLVIAVPDLCSPHQAALLTCPIATVFHGSSIVWGLIGPERLFGIGKMYNPILWWLFVGAALPVLTWLAARRWPNTWVAYINVPVAMTGAIFMPPATGINFSSWFLVGYIFQFVLRRKYFRWWSKYNFVLSAALDSATAISIVVIFLCLYLPKNGAITLDWWGNNVFANTLDWNGVSYKTPPPEGFGPATW